MKKDCFVLEKKGGGRKSEKIILKSHPDNELPKSVKTLAIPWEKERENGKLRRIYSLPHSYYDRFIEKFKKEGFCLDDECNEKAVIKLK